MTIMLPGQSQQGDLRALIIRVGVISGLVLLLVLGAMALAALSVFDDDLRPELARKMAALGDTMASDLQRAVDARIPLDRLPGLPAYFDYAVASAPELDYVALTGPQGRGIAGSSLIASGNVGAFQYEAVLAAERLRLGQGGSAADLAGLVVVGGYRNLALPIHDQSGLIAVLHLGVPDGLVAEKLREAAQDVGVSLLVALVITLEVLTVLIALLVRRPLLQLRAVFTQRAINGHGRRQPRDELDRLVLAAEDVIRHIRERAGRVDPAAASASLASWSAPQAATPAAPEMVNLRLPLFLYMVGVELVRSFLVIYFDQLYRPLPPLGRELVIALPVVSWCLAVFLAAPLASWLGRRVSMRALFIIGCLPTIAASALMGMAQDIVDLVVLRAVIGLGTGTVIFAALLHVTENAPEGNLARGMAAYVAASVAGGLVGTALGGILADTIGFRSTFEVVALVVAVAAVVGWRLLPASCTVGVDKVRQRVGWGAMMAVLGERQVLLLSLLSTLPTRSVLYGGFTFLLPLMLFGMGLDTGTIGQIMMCYFLALLALAPLIADHIERSRAPQVVLIAGGLVVGIAALLMGTAQTRWDVLAGVTLLGIGQALVTGSQFAVVSTLLAGSASHQAAVASSVRTVERVAALIAPPLVSVAAGLLGFGPAIAWMGAMVLASTILLWLLRPRRPGRT